MNKPALTFILLPALLLLCLTSACRRHRNPSGAVADRLFQQYEQQHPDYPFTVSCYGTSEEMYAGTDVFSVFLDLKEQTYDQALLDTLATQLAGQIVRELIPQHHLRHQLKRITIDFETKTIPVDTTRHDIVYRSVKIANSFEFHGDTISRIIHSEANVHEFEKLIDDVRRQHEQDSLDALRSKYWF